jgi:hypothetical protein
MHRERERVGERTKERHDRRTTGKDYLGRQGGELVRGEDQASQSAQLAELRGDLRQAILE